MRALLGQVGAFYVFNVALWAVVSLLAWGFGKAFGASMAGRRVEPETLSARETKLAAIHTLTQSMLALSVLQAVLLAAFPKHALPPLTPLRFALELGSAMLVWDFLFYVAHRSLHSRFLWRFHDLHHRFRLVNFWVRNADAAGQVFTIGAFAIPMNFLPMHIESQMALLLMSTTWNLLQHVGYEVFPRKPWIARFLITPTHHSMHHTEMDCHYGYFFTFWDDAFRSTHPTYRARFLDGPGRAVQTAPAAYHPG